MIFPSFKFILVAVMALMEEANAQYTNKKEPSLKSQAVWAEFKNCMRFGTVKARAGLFWEGVEWLAAEACASDSTAEHWVPASEPQTMRQPGQSEQITRKQMISFPSTNNLQQNQE